MEHGKSGSYSSGCRCDPCRAAWAAYMRDWSSRNKDKVAASKSKQWREQTPEQREARAAYMRQYYADNHEALRQRHNELRRQRRAENPEAWEAEKQALYVAWKRDPSKRAIVYRRHLLKKKYGMTLEEYDAMLAAQDGACAICRREQVGMHLHVDHCHDTNVVRGLLCSNCNTGLGLFGDEPTNFIAAIEYLERNRR